VNSKRELLEEARGAIELAIENIRTAVRGTSEQGRAEAYILPHLQSWIDGREVCTIESLLQKLGGGRGADGGWTEEDFEGLESALLSSFGNFGDRKLDMIMKVVRSNEDGWLDKYQPGDEEMLDALGDIYDL
jgi:hypothetical protein